MFWKSRLLSAAGIVGLLAASSWLPGQIAQGGAPVVPPLDLARPALVPPSISAAVPTSGLRATMDFFFALSEAVAENPSPAGADSPPEAAEASEAPGPAYARAYAYLAAPWRTTQGFAAFVAMWRPVRALDLLAVLAAGTPPGAPSIQRTFVEVRTLEDFHGKAVVLYQDGFYRAARFSRGYYLVGGSLTTEELSTPSVPPPTAASVAIAAVAAAHPGSSPTVLATQAATASHTVTITVAVRPQTTTYQVQLYQLVSGQWVVTQNQSIS